MHNNKIVGYVIYTCQHPMMITHSISNGMLEIDHWHITNRTSLTSIKYICYLLSYGANRYFILITDDNQIFYRGN